eukprot:TRINITY_DN20093_c0_g1_i2.p1 TRINITY_DN20093_c0_g1~~TRINITY_DN20093_c0_g1_i2.p1  ORF type:complete len:437 (-),score=33.71 TRINITY_DN20093_c0_g1_i2:78-1388(-)
MDAARDVSASIGQFLQGGSRSGRLGKLLEVLRCLHHMPGLVPRGRFDESQAGETPDYDDVESWLAHPQRRPGERAVEDANHLAPKDVILPVVEERPCDCFFVVDSCAITVAWLFGDAEINYVRTFKEIVGTVVGTIVGGLPGMLLRAFPTSNVTIQTFTVCCIMSTYYASFTYLWYKDHLDWRITFLLFTCFGSAEMLADLSNVSENLGDGYEASQYQMMIDLLAGCMFLLGCHAFVRPLFFNDPVDAASEKVAVTLTCLSRCLKIIEGKEMVDDDATKLSAIERTIGEFTISLSEARDAIGYADSLKPFHWKGHIAQKVVDACVAIEKDMLLVMYVMNAFPAQDTCGMLAVSLPSDLSVRVDELSDLAKAVLSQGSTDGSGRASKQFTPKTMSLKANASVHEEISHHVLELVMSRISDNLAGIESCLSVQDIISK